MEAWPSSTASTGEPMEEDERRQVILNARAEVERPFASDYVPPEVDALERWSRPMPRRPERQQHQESYWQGWTDARISAALERSNKVRIESTGQVVSELRRPASRGDQGCGRRAEGRGQRAAGNQAQGKEEGRAGGDRRCVATPSTS